MEKWAKEEKETREKNKLYESTKPKRNIEGSQTFGYVKDSEEVGELHKNTVQLSAEEQRQIDGSKGEEDIERYFSGMSDD